MLKTKLPTVLCFALIIIAFAMGSIFGKRTTQKEDKNDEQLKVGESIEAHWPTGHCFEEVATAGEPPVKVFPVKKHKLVVYRTNEKRGKPIDGYPMCVLISPNGEELWCSVLPCDE